MAVIAGGLIGGLVGVAGTVFYLYKRFFTKPSIEQADETPVGFSIF